MAAAVFDPDSLLRILARHEVECIVIGGFAAALHGSPYPTADVDVTPRRTEANLARLSAALYEMKARIRTDAVPEGLPFHHDATSLAAARVWNMTTEHGDLDISFEPAGTQGYDDLRQGAVTMLVRGATVQVAALADVVRSKQAADRDKDHRTLPGLRQLLARQRREQP